MTCAGYGLQCWNWPVSLANQQFSLGMCHLEQQGMNKDEAKAMAKDAGSWMKRRGCLFWGVAIVGGLWVLGALLPDTPEQQAKAVAEQAVADAMAGTNPEAVTKTTPNALLQAYEANEVAAKAKFGGRVLEVTGKVHSIQLDLTDDPVIWFETGSRYDRVHAGFDKSAAAATSALSKGQTVTVRCAKITEALGTPLLMDCQLVP